MKVRARRTTHRVSRLARLLTGRNALRRPVDRIEGAVLVALSAAFVAAMAIACIFGVHTYQLQRVATAGLRPAAALLLAGGPAGGSMGRVEQTEARWFVPGGGERSGVLTTETAPDIVGAAAGDRISLWLNRSGQPVAPPADQTVMIIYALTAGAVITALAGMTLFLAYALCRHALDRRRLVAWESAWNQTGPSWTTRRLAIRSWRAQVLALDVPRQPSRRRHRRTLVACAADCSVGTLAANPGPEVR